MIVLYTKPNCPYCAKVLPVFLKLEIEKEERDISNLEYLKELVETGGKSQVPYLVDKDKGVSIYESDDVLNYLKSEYGLDTPEGSQQTSPNVCPI